MAGSGEELYSFTYSDGLRRGCHIVEQLHVDKIAGRFTWTRGLQSEGKEVASKRQGSSYVISHVSSVRFATRLGDPNSEFLSATQRQLVKHRAIRTWLSSNAPSILGLLAVLFNALTVTLVLAACLCHATWQVFPQAGDSFDMSQGPDSEALAAAATLSVLTVLAATVAGWWLGIFRCRCCGFKAFERETVGTATRLTSKIAARCKIQRPLTGAVLAVCILWCFFVLLLCPIAYGLSRRTMCDEGSCSPEPGSPLLPTCGVGRCRCGGLADLTCITASAGQDLSLCRNVKQPMCTAAGSDQTASGVHLPLLASAVGSTGVAVLLGLVWLLNAWGMYAGWVRAIDPSEVVMVPQVQYHRFSVNFRSRSEGKLIFTLSAEDDPHGVAAALMPPGPPRGRAGLAVMYQAPDTMLGSYVPGMPVPGMTGSDWGGASYGGYTSYAPPIAGDEREPRWC